MERLKETSGVHYGTIGHAAAEFVKQSLYLDLAESKEVQSLCSNIMGADIVPLKRKILRTYSNERPLASPAHRDIEYFPEGSDQIITLWVPIGDCPVETGGIAYLKKSQNLEFSNHDFKTKKYVGKNFQDLANKYSTQWLSADFEAGHVVLHSPYILHGTLDCTTDYKRVSTDIRFLKKDEKQDWRWSDYWRADDGY